jgi:hypothetical protein
MKSAGVVMMLRIGWREPEVHDDPQSLCVSWANFDSRREDEMVHFGRKGSFAGSCQKAWEDSELSWYLEVPSDGSISKATTELAEIPVEQSGSVARDVTLAIRRVEVQYC